MPAPPETIKPPVLTVAESVVDVDAIPEAVTPMPWIFPDTFKILVVESYVNSASDPIVLFPDQIVTLPAAPEPFGIWAPPAKNDVA